MGTITTRKRSDGTLGYTAQIRLKKGGKLIYSEAQTFDRKAAAAIWLKKRETELAQPGGLERLQQRDPTLAEVIAQYIKEHQRELGRTKAQVLRTISASSLAKLKCSEIGSPQIMEYAQSLDVQPQTVGNYMSHLAAVFAVAKPMWGYPLDREAMQSAVLVGKRMGVVSKSRERDRRPTLDELDKLLTHYTEQAKRNKATLPMVDIVLFALFSTRRQEEITRITWEDLHQERREVIVRNMKHPGEKQGNDVRVSLPDEALIIILRQPGEHKGPIFPFDAGSISASFTRACKLLGIDNLTFHDLRHEGVSRLFELGRTIPMVASVSGHRSWQSLKRYTHLHEVGDKYAGWRWNPLSPPPDAPAPAPAGTA